MNSIFRFCGILRKRIYLNNFDLNEFHNLQNFKDIVKINSQGFYELFICTKSFGDVNMLA